MSEDEEEDEFEDEEVLDDIVDTLDDISETLENIRDALIDPNTGTSRLEQIYNVLLRMEKNSQK